MTVYCWSDKYEKHFKGCGDGESPGLRRDRPSSPLLFSQRSDIDEITGYVESAQVSETVRQSKALGEWPSQWTRTSYRTSGRVRREVLDLEALNSILMVPWCGDLTHASLDPGARVGEKALTGIICCNQGCDE